jgi:CHAD domain-containing protein
VARPWKVVDLDPKENLKTCLHKIALTRFQETFSYEFRAMKGEDIEALHNMRLAARRLRAILRIFRECFPKKKFKRQDETLRRLIRSLGAVREHDVFIELIERHRRTMTQQEGTVVDLLLARQRDARSLLRRELLSELRGLKRRHYDHTFTEFLKEHL